ncbi:MAG TPA: hypothetical protein VGJ66_24450 [Pyrinomonadaceae bacterium]
MRAADAQRYIASPSKEIMDFEKYSKLQFDSRGVDSSAARQLANELQDDVAKEIHDSVLATFLKVVEGLNAQGHNLQPYDEISVGDISFRDERIEGQCLLRLACDSIISSGYSHTITPHEAEAEIES